MIKESVRGENKSVSDSLASSSNDEEDYEVDDVEKAISKTFFPSLNKITT